MSSTALNVFFDTSALVKYFYEEPGSDRVTELIEAPEHTPWCSRLACVEFVSAMHRRYREGALDGTQLERALAGFEQAMAAFRIEALNRTVVSDAEALLKTHGREDALRTLDALHLATYLRLANHQWRFVVADDRLYSVAEKKGGCSDSPAASRRIGLSPIRFVGSIRTPLSKICCFRLVTRFAAHSNS
jgi:predicted nucleic acid-binding protein